MDDLDALFEIMSDAETMQHYPAPFDKARTRSWIEDQEYMLRSDENRITPDPDIMVRKESEWSDGTENVFMEAEEPWEIKVAKKTLDYLIVSKKHRQKGVGRALFYNYVEWCRQNNIDNVYIWPDGETPKRIYEEGGYRVSEIRKAGRGDQGITGRDG